MFISVKFNPKHDRSYTYLFDLDAPVSPGDIVEVETRDGMKCVTVCEVDLDEPPFPCKPVISVVRPDPEAAT